MYDVHSSFIKSKYFTHIFGTKQRGVIISIKIRSITLQRVTSQPCSALENAKIPINAIEKNK